MTLLSAILRVRRMQVLGYAIAVLLSFLALWTRLQLANVFEGFPFLTFFIAVLLSALIGGLGPGLVAAILSGLLAQYFLIAPEYSLEILSVSGWVALAFYGITVAAMVGLVHGITLAYQGQLEAQRKLSDLNRTLEQRVAERTAQLMDEIDERQAAESQIRQMQKIEAVGQLTGGIAHDFNNMLAVVIGSLELAKVRAEAQDDERITRYIGVAHEGANRAASLTARLMAFSRQQPLAPQAVDANVLVANASELLRRTLGDPIEVRTVLAGRLWHCFADPVQLENALLNLAINARDAMPDGGRLSIETANREIGADERDGLPAGQYVMLAVTDSGTGMPASVVERAFDPFFTTKGVGKGTGLGLSQIYGYVKQSGGAVTIDSVVGEGTRVELLFPRFAGPVSIASSPREGDAMPVGSPASTILLVEDEDRVRQVAEEALRELGYTVVSVSGPRLALEALADTGQVDLLLTDVMMPEMSGRVLAEKAVDLRPGLKVLYMSGYTPETEGAGVPGAMLLAKPFTLERLAQAVRTSIDR